MSVAEIQSELNKLTPAELAQVENYMRGMRTPPLSPTSLADYWKSLSGTVILKPGWDQDESAETWEAVRDNSPAYPIA